MNKKLLMAGLVLMLLTGCVTTEKFEASEAARAASETELATCRDGLDVCRANAAAAALRCDNRQRQQDERIAMLEQELQSCHKDVGALSSRAQSELLRCTEARHDLESRLAAASRDLAQCRQQVAGEQANVQAMSERAAQLRLQLQSEIADKNVEIDQLRDQLSVRVLDRILFRSGSAEILPSGRAVLDKLADLLGKGDDYIRVEGHTDIVPIGVHLQEKYPTNWELSTARASSVVRYFEAGRKIDPLRMEAVGFSKYRPVAEGKSPEDLQRNRRVEIVLTVAKRR